MKHIVAGCTGKMAFNTFTRAGKVAKRMRQFDHGCHVEPYHCQHCQKFHVGENRDYHPKTKQKGAPREE